MNAQGKLLFYIIIICLLLYLVQDKYDFLDIEFVSDKQKSEVVDRDKSENNNTDDFKIDTGTLDIRRKDGNTVKVNIEIADTEEERIKGLMYRTELGAYNGMLFIFDKETNNSFWMKNTKIPLDLVFISSDKRIIEVIENAQPCIEGHVCPVLKPGFKYRYCLEVNGGFIKANRIKLGDTVEWKVK